MYKDLVLPLMIVGANTARFEMYLQQKIIDCQYGTDKLSREYEQGRADAFDEVLNEYRQLMQGMQIL